MFDTSQKFEPRWNQGVTIVPGEPISASTAIPRESVHTTIIELVPGFMSDNQLVDITFDGTIPPIVSLEKFMKRIKQKKSFASQT